GFGPCGRFFLPQLHPMVISLPLRAASTPPRHSRSLLLPVAGFLLLPWSRGIRVTCDPRWTSPRPTAWKPGSGWAAPRHVAWSVLARVPSALDSLVGGQRKGFT